MPQANKARHTHWQHHINQWRASELSGTAYCDQHQLPYHCFIYWRSKLSKAAANGNGSTEATPDTRPSSAFIAVRPQSSSVAMGSANADSLHLCLPNGLEIRNITASNVGNVRALLAGLS